MQVCMYCVYACMYVQKKTPNFYSEGLTFVGMCEYMYVCVYVCMLCMYVFEYACMHVFMYVCVYVCMYVCMYVCVRF